MKTTIQKNLSKTVSVNLFDKPGKYVVTFKSKELQPLWFNWIWLEKSKN